MNITERLQQVIEYKNITPYEISIKTGVDESILSRIISGKTKKPQKTTISRIAKYLQISENWLLTGLGDIRVGQEDESIDAEIDAVVQKMLSEGKTIGGSVPYEFVQQLFRERETHDQVVLSQQKIIDSQQRTIEQLTMLLNKKQL